MSPTIKINSYVFVEMNGLVKHKEIGLFRVDDEFIVRKLIYRKNHLILKALDKKYKDIIISDLEDFQIIGRIYI